MLNKTIKFLGVAVFGLMLSAYSPTLSLAQSSPGNGSVMTRGATEITTSTATLNGLVSTISNLYTAAWFEYGQNTALGYSTPRNSGSGYFNYSYSISGLRPNTTYYFRSVMQNSYELKYGNVEYFTTNSNGINTGNNYTAPLSLTVITEPASSIDSASVVLKSIIYNQENISSDTWFEYGPSANLGSATTPTGTGGFPIVKHINTLKGLSPRTTYYYRAVVVNPSSLRVSGNILSFTTSAGVSTTITTSKSVTDTGSIQSVTESDFGASLGANVFSTGSFLPVSLFGWLLLLILILILILLSKYLYGVLHLNSEKTHQ